MQKCHVSPCVEVGKSHGFSHSLLLTYQLDAAEPEVDMGAGAGGVSVWKEPGSLNEG